jgi:hypothetical protein
VNQECETVVDEQNASQEEKRERDKSFVGFLVTRQAVSFFSLFDFFNMCDRAYELVETTYDEPLSHDRSR